MTRTPNSACRGWSLVELMVVVLIIGVILRISLPRMQTTLLNYRLTAAASSVSGAIQKTRYQAIMIGCPYTIAFTSTSTTYQIQSQALTTDTPPKCQTQADGVTPKFSNVGAALPWTTGASISMSPSTTLQFNANGVVGPPPSPATSPLVPCSPCTFTISNGNATRTFNVSGVGNVTVTSP
jgi:prepilin-type N-terminal cleavage/methylation domain-containing protein